MALQQFDESHNSAFYSEALFRCKASECVDTVNCKITDYWRRRCFSRPIDRGKTVSKLFALEPLGLALSEKQIPQIIQTIRSVEN